MASESEIKTMKRGELNQLAAGYGLNPDDYSRADDLRSAIFTYLKSKDTVDSTPAETDKSEDDTKSKPAKQAAAPAKPPQPRAERRSRRYQEAHKLVDKDKSYELAEAVALLAQTSTVKFNAAVELHLNLGVDTKQSDQLVRGSVMLPHGSGKSQRVAALVPEADEDNVKKAGADAVDSDKLLEQISKGEFNFDILVAHPDVMKDLSKHAKTLGPKGLMPSPKAGTVTPDVAKTVKELKGGRIEFRVDRYGIIHQTVGRVSFKPEQLAENIKALMATVQAAKPASLKGTYLAKATLTTTMGPGIRLSTAAL